MLKEHVGKIVPQSERKKIFGQVYPSLTLEYTTTSRCVAKCNSKSKMGGQDDSGGAMKASGI